MIQLSHEKQGVTVNSDATKSFLEMEDEMHDTARMLKSSGTIVMFWLLWL